jgi:general secretion pathway protein C
MIGSIVRNLASIFGGGAVTYIAMSSGQPPAPSVKEIVIRERVVAVPPAPVEVAPPRAEPPPVTMDLVAVQHAFDSRARGRAECRDLYAIHGVAALTPTSRVVERGFILRALENQAELMHTARIIPVQRDGHVTGVKIFGVKPDSMLSILGFQNGDELQTVNGYDITAPDRALEAYARLNTADVLEAGIVRNGLMMRLFYVVC